MKKDAKKYCILGLRNFTEICATISLLFVFTRVMELFFTGEYDLNTALTALFTFSLFIVGVPFGYWRLFVLPFVHINLEEIKPGSGEIGFFGYNISPSFCWHICRPLHLAGILLTGAFIASNYQGDCYELFLKIGENTGYLLFAVIMVTIMLALMADPILVPIVKKLGTLIPWRIKIIRK